MSDPETIRWFLYGQANYNFFKNKDVTGEYLYKIVKDGDEYIYAFRNTNCKSLECIYDLEQIIELYRDGEGDFKEKTIKCFKCERELYIKHFHPDRIFNKIVKFVQKKYNSKQIACKIIKINTQGQWNAVLDYKKYENRKEKQNGQDIKMESKEVINNDSTFNPARMVNRNDSNFVEESEQNDFSSNSILNKYINGSGNQSYLNNNRSYDSRNNDSNVNSYPNNDNDRNNRDRNRNSIIDGKNNNKGYLDNMNGKGYFNSVDDKNDFEKMNRNNLDDLDSNLDGLDGKKNKQKKIRFKQDILDQSDDTNVDRSLNDLMNKKQTQNQKTQQNKDPQYSLRDGIINKGIINNNRNSIANNRSSIANNRSSIANNRSSIMKNTSPGDLPSKFKDKLLYQRDKTRILGNLDQVPDVKDYNMHELTNDISQFMGYYQKRTSHQNIKIANMDPYQVLLSEFSEYLLKQKIDLNIVYFLVEYLNRMQLQRDKVLFNLMQQIYFIRLRGSGRIIHLMKNELQEYENLKRLYIIVLYRKQYYLLAVEKDQNGQNFLYIFDFNHKDIDNPEYIQQQQLNISNFNHFLQKDFGIRMKRSFYMQTYRSEKLDPLIQIMCQLLKLFEKENYVVDYLKLERDDLVKYQNYIWWIILQFWQQQINQNITLNTEEEINNYGYLLQSRNKRNIDQQMIQIERGLINRISTKQHKKEDDKIIRFDLDYENLKYYGNQSDNKSNRDKDKDMSQIQTISLDRIKLATNLQYQLVKQDQIKQKYIDNDNDGTINLVKYVIESPEEDIDIQFACSLTDNQDLKYLLRNYTTKQLKQVIMENKFQIIDHFSSQTNSLKKKRSMYQLAETGNHYNNSGSEQQQISLPRLI